MLFGFETELLPADGRLVHQPALGVNEDRLPLW
jgi:hypothetical protein